jgi:type IV pilus secretin PilQ/predicted competence protein
MRINRKIRDNMPCFLIPVFVLVAAIPLYAQFDGRDNKEERASVLWEEANGSEGLLTMDFKDADLRNVLRLIAEQNGLNIIAGPDITGQVTVRLKGVTVNEALRNILRSNGFHFVRDDNVILVQPDEGSIVETDRSTRVFSLQYIDGRDVKRALDGILSEKGKVQTFSRTMGEDNAESAGSNVLIVSDEPPILREIAAIIRDLDVPEPQIMIEARIIETLFTKEDRVGIAWPTTFQFLYSKLSLSDKYSSSSDGGSESGSSEKIGASFEYGMLSVKDFQAALDLLSQEQKSKLISNPRITTLNNQEAEIAVTTSVPIMSVNRFSFAAESQDVATYEYIDIGITLKVTPRVNDERTITMEVSPTIEEIAGYTGPVEFQVPITTKRSTETKIRVEDGETIMIGGLLRDNKRETHTKVWLLGDIPLLGRLFRHTAVLEEQNDLIIFITPHIVEG